MPKDMSQNPHPQQALMQALDYTPDDLQANRAGVVTVHQQEQITSISQIGSCGLRLAISAWLATVGCMVGITLYSYNQPGFQQIWPNLLAGCMIFTAIFGAFMALGLLRMRNLRHLQVQITEGPATTSSQKLRGGRWTAYYVTIGAVRFQLTSRAQWTAFHERQRYRVYYLHYPPTHLILSVE